MKSPPFYMLVRERPSQSDPLETQLDVAFIGGAMDARAMWARALRSKILGTGHTRASLRKLGWRARRVRVELVP